MLVPDACSIWDSLIRKAIPEEEPVEFGPTIVVGPEDSDLPFRGLPVDPCGVIRIEMMPVPNLKTRRAEDHIDADLASGVVQFVGSLSLEAFQPDIKIGIYDTPDSFVAGFGLSNCLPNHVLKGSAARGHDHQRTVPCEEVSAILRSLHGFAL